MEQHIFFNMVKYYLEHGKLSKKHFKDSECYDPTFFSAVDFKYKGRIYDADITKVDDGIILDFSTQRKEGILVASVFIYAKGSKAKATYTLFHLHERGYLPPRALGIRLGKIAKSSEVFDLLHKRMEKYFRRITKE